MSRVLTCTGCGDEVEVFEEPCEWIDPERYRCGTCSPRKAEPAPDRQLALVSGPARQETPTYDPAMAAVPY